MNCHRLKHIGLASLTMLFSITLTAEASTVGHWRFEDGSFLSDSGPNGLTLIQAGSPAAVSTPFPNPVPQTGQANAGAADLGTSQDGHFGFTETAANEIQVSDFTIEAYIRQGAADFSAATYLVSEWTDQLADRGWALGVGEGSGSRQQGELFLLLATSASGLTIVESNLGILIEQNKDYFVAASFDESNQANGVTFVIENLTDNVSQTVAVGHSVTSLYQPITTFRIGTIDNQASRRWPGVIDEVRLSDTVLNSSELLNAAVPEPASLLLLGAGAVTVLGGRRHSIL